jgi:hypothetical protein
MVEILPAPGGIDPGRLQMAGGIRTDPYVTPRRRNDEITTAPQLCRVGQDATMLVDERDTTPTTTAPITGPARIASPKPHAPQLPTLVPNYP